MPSTSYNLFIKFAEMSVEPNAHPITQHTRIQKPDEADRDRMARRAHTAKRIRHGGKSNRKKMAFGGPADPIASDPFSRGASMGVNARDIPLRGE